MTLNLVKVSATSSPGKVAGAIAGMVREGDKVRVQTIGSAALVRAVCAISLATKFLEEELLMVLCNVKAIRVEIDGDKMIDGYRFDLTVLPI